MLAIAIAAASQITAPTLVGDLSQWSWKELPFSVQAAGIPRVASTRTTVRPDGSVERCDVEQSSGNATVDSATCRIMLTKTAFEPARGPDGSALFGVVRQVVIWAPYGALHLDPRGSFKFEVARLPHGFRLPYAVQVAFAVDEQGHISSCLRQPVPGEIGWNTDVVRLACERLLDGRTVAPATNDAGVAVPSIQDASVLFVKAPG